MATRKPLVLIYGGILLSFAAFAISINGIFPLITKLSEGAGFPFSSFGTILFVQFCAFGLTSLVLSRAAKLFTRGTPALVAWGLVGLCLLLLSTPLMKTYFHLHIWAFFLGVSGSAVETGCSVLITDYDDPGSSRMLNLAQAVYCVGAIAAPQVVAFLLGARIPWTASFIVLSGIIGIITIVFVVTNLGKTATSIHAATAGVVAGNETGNEDTARRPFLVLLFIAMFLYAGSEAGLASWIPSFFEKHHGLTAAKAAMRLSLFWGGLVVGRFLVFLFSSRINTRSVLITGTWGMAMSGILFVLLDGSGVDTVVVFLIGLAAGPVWPCIVAVSRELGRSPRTASAIIGAGAFGVAVFPLLTGWMIRRFGFTAMFSLLGISSLTMAIAITVLYSTITIGRKTAFTSEVPHEI